MSFGNYTGRTVPIHPGDRENTVFTVPDGRHFQLCAIPFRLKCVQATFQAMKARINPERMLYVQTDASAEGVGAVLYQRDENEDRCIIDYASAQFGCAEWNYHSNEQECLAVTLQGWKIKLVRWALFLQLFDFVVEHIPGVENKLPDALSQYPDEGSCLEDEVSWDEILPPGRENLVSEDVTLVEVDKTPTSDDSIMPRGMRGLPCHPQPRNSDAGNSMKLRHKSEAMQSETHDADTDL
ncbi:uncharacterized protein LOC134546142 [Bacillus rossius redtenbacheri]|uniref:uncharacterized protein LOC134546142 n=1 Tax=Bacillus rossius redtenbacheri TaxID=93214 RepID=UPI002FDDEEC6